MSIIGCDFDTRYQQIAMANDETGELLVERRLDHENSEAERFCRALPGPVRVRYPKLREHLGSIVTLMKLSTNYKDFLGHNAVYLLAGFLCFCWLKHEEGEEEPSTVQKHSREGYNLAALLFFFLFLDNLLRIVEGRGWKGFWPCSGRFDHEGDL
jgi:hypothetical protein